MPTGTRTGRVMERETEPDGEHDAGQQAGPTATVMEPDGAVTGTRRKVPVGVERPVDEADMSRARSKSERILTLNRLGLKAGSIARDTSLPLGAVKRVIAESSQPVLKTSTTPSAQPGLTTPDQRPAPGPGPSAGESSAPRLSAEPGGWGAAGPIPPSLSAYSGIPGDPAPTLLGGDYTIPDVYAQLRETCVEFGLSDRLARGVVRQFGHLRMNDYAGLDAILAAAGAPMPARRSIVNSFKLETDPDASRAGGSVESDPIADARRRRADMIRSEIESLELEQLRKSIRGGGGDGAESAELVRLRERNSLLEAQVRDQALLTAFDGKLAPLRDELRELRSRPSTEPLTTDSLKMLMNKEAFGSLLRTADSRLQQTGSGQALIKQLGASLGPKVVRYVGTQLDLDSATAADGTGTAAGPSEAEMAALLAGIGGGHGQAEPPAPEAPQPYSRGRFS
ncbi:MAG: hypothetical protein L3J97_06535 [Thermoplasmata archaeon]|nr:hypothetical protein [Thermoplasmata archaeon]